MNMSAYALGNAVRLARKDKHLSQEALAERIGVCKRTIIDIENSVGNPKFEILYPLVRELNLPLTQVFYPEVIENSKLKELLLHEVDNCTEYEIKIILSVVKSLKYTLQNEKEMFIEANGI